MSYTAPLKDMLFNIEHLARIDQIAQLPGMQDAGLETAQAVLEEAAKFCEGVLAPLNWEGDKNPSTWKDGVVTASPGFKDAFKQYTEAGWQGLQHPTDFGGQGLPKTIGAMVGEMQNSANMSFALCPLLTDGAIEALLTAGSPELNAIYLEKLVSGEWTGTMNLTEPQAGSDLAAVRTSAEPQSDGSYKVFGTKIFITWGEHDMADNIIHLVLARVTGAPEGVKGISLFVVPKFMVNTGRSPGRAQRRALCLHRTQDGHQGQPHGGAAVWRPRRCCGLPGGPGKPRPGVHVHHDERRALRRRCAGHRHCRAGLPKSRAVRQRPHPEPPGRRLAAGAGPIIHHPDVKRMLMTMRATTEGCRALSSVAAAAYDAAHHHRTPTRASKTRRSTNSWCPSSRVTAPR